MAFFRIEKLLVDGEWDLCKTVWGDSPLGDFHWGILYILTRTGEFHQRNGFNPKGSHSSLLKIRLHFNALIEIRLSKLMTVRNHHKTSTKIACTVYVYFTFLVLPKSTLLQINLIAYYLNICVVLIYYCVFSIGVETRVNNKASHSESSTNILHDMHISCGELPAFVQSKTERYTFKRKCLKYFVEGGHLYFKNKVKDILTKKSVEVVLQVVIDEEKRQELIKLTHEGADCGESTTLKSHRGINTTQYMISERFFWPSFSKDVRSYIKNCKSCQFVNKNLTKISS